MKNIPLHNRDLSWLLFNDRVLQEAAGNDVPLYERMKFLAIFSSNLDEFFRVRYPEVVALSNLDKKTIRKESLLSKKDIAQKVQDFVHRQLQYCGELLVNEIIPALATEGVTLYYNKLLPEVHLEEVREIFLSQVLSFIQPVFLKDTDEANFFPANGKLYFIVTLQHASSNTINHVIINIPSNKLQRFYVLQKIANQEQVIFIDDIIRENLSFIFPNQVIQSVYSIKFNRDASLPKTEDYSRNLLDKIEQSLKTRNVGHATRLLYEKGMPSNLQLYLSQIFCTSTADFYEGGRYHNLTDFFTFPVFDKRLLYSPQKPILYPKATASGDIFNEAAKGDVLLHLPYHSYTPVLSFFNQAAVDVDVASIYITLYRVASESHIVNALISAARNGKKVTAFIELKARFDEANNIKWSREMKEAGVKLIYSQPSIKVHSKIALVKKKIGKKTISYAVLCSGNFNENTASFYTDHVLITVNKKVCSELQMLFNYLKKKIKPDPSDLDFKLLLVSQFNIIERFEQLIAGEMAKAKAGKAALIRIKVNNLEEPYFIRSLYLASKAGVKIQLLIRSICCLVPGEAGLSENIEVRRIVDRYLEHSRLFIFGEGEEAVAIFGSSDLMTRNLRNRIEVCVPLLDTGCRNQIIRYFDLQWQDNVKASRILPDGLQERVTDNLPPARAQQRMYHNLHQIALENG